MRTPDNSLQPAACDACQTLYKPIEEAYLKAARISLDRQIALTLGDIHSAVELWKQLIAVEKVKEELRAKRLEHESAAHSEVFTWH